MLDASKKTDKGPKEPIGFWGAEGRQDFDGELSRTASAALQQRVSRRYSHQIFTRSAAGRIIGLFSGI